MALCFPTNLLAMIAILFQTNCNESVDTVTFTIQTAKAAPIIPDEYISISQFSFDNGFDFNDTKMNTLAKGIGPAFLRIGGDNVYYNTSQNISSDAFSSSLNMSEFSNELNFAERNNWKTIFSFNALDRFPINNSWNPTNAIQLIDKLVETNINNKVWYFELSNEPDIYWKHNETNVSAKQLSNDYFTLYNLLQNKFGTNNLSIPGIFGCDIAGATYNPPQWNYLITFLQNMNSEKNHILNGITWHHYYGPMETFNTTNYFINVTILDTLILRLNGSIEVIRNNYNDENIAIMLGETSSTYHGGTYNLSSSYVSGFMWLDKLGLSSIYGISVVMRQRFWGIKDNYSFTSTFNYTPHSDYWSSYLFNNLVGNNVLFVDNQFEYNRYIRVYAFCTRLHGNES
eukprot:524451_1